MYRVVKYWPNWVQRGDSDVKIDYVKSIDEALMLPWLINFGKLTYVEKHKHIIDKDGWILALVDFVSDCCIGEYCHMCGLPATHKISEEIMFDDPNPQRHPLSAYVCTTHFQ